MRHAPTIISAIVVCWLALAGLADSVTAQPAPAAATTVYLPLIRNTPPIQTAEQQAMAAEVLALINAERTMAGCRPLTADARLTLAAQRHTSDMANNNFFDHRGSAGTLVSDRVTSAGYVWSAVGENIAAGSPTAAEVVKGWMDSPSHRANILNCAYVHTGIGYIYDPADTALSGVRWPYYRYYTHVFGAPR